MQEGLNRQKYKRILGAIVKARRMASKKSITLISAETGMTKSMWADLEKGIKDPQLSTLIRIAEGLNVSTSEIIKELEKSLGENFTLTD